MNPDAREENIMAVVKAIESVGLTAKIMEGAQQKIVGVIGDKNSYGFTSSRGNGRCRTDSGYF